MAIVGTTRLNLTTYTVEAADCPTMFDWNTVMTTLDGAVCVAHQGPASDRLSIPLVGNQIHLDTDTGAVYWDNGTSWVPIGARIPGTQSIVATAGQSANMLEFRDASNNLMANVAPDGTFSGHFTDKNVWTAPTDPLRNGLTGTVLYKKSGDMVQVRGNVTTPIGWGTTPAVTPLAMPAALVPNYRVMFVAGTWLPGAAKDSTLPGQMVSNQVGGNIGLIQIGNLHGDSTSVVQQAQTFDFNFTYLLGN